MDALWTILAFAAGILILYVLCKLLSAPLRLLGTLVINALVGALVLLLVNWIGGLFGLSIAINPLNALITGVLGAPGVILLLVLQWIL